MKNCSIICFSGENKKGPFSVRVFQISDKILGLNIKTKILTEKTDLLTNITLAQTCLAQFVVSAIMVIFRNYGNPSNKSNFHFSNKSCLPSSVFNSYLLLPTGSETLRNSQIPRKF